MGDVTNNGEQTQTEGPRVHTVEIGGGDIGDLLGQLFGGGQQRRKPQPQRDPNEPPEVVIEALRQMLRQPKTRAAILKAVQGLAEEPPIWGILLHDCVGHPAWAVALILKRFVDWTAKFARE